MVKKWLSRIRDIKRWGKRAFVLPILAVGVIGLAAVPFATAQAQPDLGTGAGLGSNYSGGVSTCAIETVGWVICPVMRSIAKLADYGFAFINQNFLVIEIDWFGRDESGVYIAWGLIRNMGNLLFVLVFMYIVYCQITGRNTGNFNLKRILPRLIIGVIFVNISYEICMVGIQLANILGAIVTTALGGVASQIGTPAMTLDSAARGFEDGILLEITSAILQKVGTVWILLAPVAAITVSIAAICAAGLVLLIMRKVIISMLVIVSPLLFVAYLLPNLERFFQQWGRLFVQLLLLYPIIAFLLGTGQIISATIINVGSGGEANYRVTDDSYQSRSGGSGSATTDLAAAGAAVLPLLGTWFVLKGVMSVGGVIGGKISGRGDRSNIKAKAESKSGTPKQAPAPQSKLMGRTFDRKPAFSRLRRRKSAAGSTIPPATGGSKPGTKSAVGAAGSAGTANKSGLDPLSSNLANNAGDAPESAMTPEQVAEQALKDGKINDAAGASGAATGGAGDATAAIQAQLSGPEKDSKKDDKPWEKLRGAKPASGGGASGTAAAPSTPSAPVAPSSNFQAPGTAQVASSPANAAPSAPMVVAVPVQIDGASLLSGHDTQRYSPQAKGMQPLTQPPVSGTQEKAKARAQKYIFDAASSLEETEKEIDRLLGDRTKVAKELEQKDSDIKKDA